MKIDRVIIEGAKSLNAKFIVELSGVKPQELLDKVYIPEIKNHLVTHPMIKEAHVECQLPNVLRLKIVERIPVASINLDDIYPIDIDGVVLSKISSISKNISPEAIDFPLISGISNIGKIQEGIALNHNEIFQALEILSLSQSIGCYHMISEINMNQGKDIQLYSVDGGIPIIIGRNNYQKRLITFYEFWKKFIEPDNARNLCYVDVRFDGQVVVKWRQNLEENVKKISNIIM